MAAASAGAAPSAPAADELYWLPWLACYQQLQAANRSSLAGLQELLRLAQPWLLDGLARFRQPSAASAAALRAGRPLKAPSFGPKKGIAIDKHLISATLELAQLLDLDELQCHLLLKRWLKDNDVSIPPPAAAAAAAPAAPGAAAGALLALPAPGPAPAAAAGARAPGGQAVLPADVVQGVADAYGQERLYLTKCQQFVLMAAMDVAADASRSCRDLLKQLLDRDVGSRVFEALAASLKPRSPAGQAATGTGAAGSSSTALVLTSGSSPGDAAHLVKPPAFEHHAHLHLLHERCELMCLLTQLYCGADATTSPTIHALKDAAAVAASDAAAARAAEEAGGHGDAAAAAALAELCALRWPGCSEERLLQLLQLLGDAVFAAGAGLAAAAAAAVQLQWPGASGDAAWAGTADGAAGQKSQSVAMQQLAEALASSLILAALQPAVLLERLAEAAPAAAAGGPLPRSLSPYKQWRSIEAALMQWRYCPGCALALLALYAYNQLLASWRGGGGVDAISPSLQESALRAGGFAALAAPLGAEELAGCSVAGALHRGLLLQGLALLAAAFNLSPWMLQEQQLQPLVGLIGEVVAGCPHLAQQVWDESVIATAPLRHFVNEACELFPAFPGPFLQLATGLAVGPAAAAAAYGYLCSKPSLAVEFAGPGVAGLQVLAGGREAVLTEDVPWSQAPEVQGSYLPQGSRGKILPLPAFARPPSTPGRSGDDDMADEGAAGTAGPALSTEGPFLVAWDVAADQGTGPVLMLARAAHCLQQLHATDAARQPVAASEHWQDLRLMLRLVAALLRGEPLQAKPLLGVTIVYTHGQVMDWLDIIIAALNVLPALAASAGPAVPPAPGAGRSGGSFAWQLLSALADCLAAAGAFASCQPGRVLGALCSCQLLAGVVAAPDPLHLVPLEGLSSWIQGQHGAGVVGAEDWSSLTTLQGLQEALEVPATRYPLTAAVIDLTASLLAQQATWGPVPSLVGFALHRVLGAMPWLPFACTSSRWRLAAAALGAVRAALLSGSVVAPGAAAPKAAGPPGGLMVTALAAQVAHHLATAGHGYLSAVLPPPAAVLRDMAEQLSGSSQLLAAGSELAHALLLLVPVLLAACSHLSPEMPLQQWWAADPPGGGLRPAGVLASYATYPYAPHLPLLALETLNAFAVLQAAPAARSSAVAGAGGAATPSAGGPPVWSGSARMAVGVGPLAGPVHAGLLPGHSHRHGHGHGYGPQQGIAAAGLGVAGRGTGGWWRPSGLFTALLAALPGLKAALIAPLQPGVAAEYAAWAIGTINLLEAGIRFHPELLDAMCFPSALAPADAPAGGSSSSSHGGAHSAGGAKPGTPAAKPFSALDGLWQLLRQAPQLMASQPKLLAAVLRVLSVLWDCQGSAHGAVELLRSQPGFWLALKACLPVAASLPCYDPTAELADAEAAAWKLQVHASTLHILLLELLSVPQVHAPAPASAKGGAPAASDPEPEPGHQSLLSAFGPREVAQLLLACSALGLQQPLLSQLARLFQVAYLQLGSTAVVGAWGPPELRADGLTVAAQFRAEVGPLLQAAAAGEFSRADLSVACELLADPEASAAAACATAAAAAGDSLSPGSAAATAAAASAGQRGSVLVEALASKPFGEVLLSYAAVTPFSWSAGDTEYGRQFLLDSNRLIQLLGAFNLDACEGAVGLAITLDDVSAAASVAHARLALLQACASLLACLGRHAPARAQLLEPGVSIDVLTTCVRAADRSMSQAVSLTSSDAAPLLSVPWGLHFIGHASSAALLLAARSMLLSVRVWKVSAAGAAAAGSSAGASARPALMARSLNQQQQAGALKGPSPLAAAGAGAGGVPSLSLSVCAQCAGLLSRWLRGRGGESLAEAAVTAAAAAGGTPAAGSSAAVEDDVEVVECLSTSLLLMLQALPGQQRAGAGAGAASSGSPTVRGASGRRGSMSPPGPSGGASKVAALAALAAGDRPSPGQPAGSPAELLELEAALLDLLPALCKACALAVDQQQHAATAAAAAAAAGGTSPSAARQAYAAAMLQLLIEVLQHHLPASLWLGAVSQHLALVPMLTAAAARAGASGPVAAPSLPAARPGDAALGSSAGIAAPPADAAGGGGSGSSAAEAAAAAAASVTDISVLELAQAVASVPEGALQLWQQGVLPVLVGYCRQLLHAAQQSGLLDVAALGLVGPDAPGPSSHGGLGGLELPPQLCVSLATMGAYVAAGVGAGVQTASGVAGASSGGGPGATIWSPRHQQWCLLLGLWGSLLQQLSRNLGVADAAMQLLVAAEPRLLLAIQLHSDGGQHASAPAGRRAAAPSRQPQGLLTLPWGGAGGLLSSSSGGGVGGAAGGAVAAAADGPDGRPVLSLGALLEAERCLFLLRFMVQHLGEWQLLRPGSLPAFRSAAARLVEFVAAPSLDRTWRVSCAPLSPFERRLSRLPSGLEASDGWFKVCSAGGANAMAPPAAAGSAAPGSAPGSAAGLVLALPAPGGAGGAGVGGAGSSDAGAGGGPGSCSEYCARLGEALYTTAEHALIFLATTAPVVEPGELAAAGGSLGPMWPSVKALSALQDQVLAVGTSMVQDQQAVTERRRRIAAACCRISTAAGHLLEALTPASRWTGAAQPSADASRQPHAVREAEAARRFERMASIQRAASMAPA